MTKKQAFSKEKSKERVDIYGELFYLVFEAELPSQQDAKRLFDMLDTAKSNRLARAVTFVVDEAMELRMDLLGEKAVLSVYSQAYPLEHVLNDEGEMSRILPLLASEAAQDIYKDLEDQCMDIMGIGSDARIAYDLRRVADAPLSSESLLKAVSSVRERDGGVMPPNAFLRGKTFCALPVVLVGDKCFMDWIDTYLECAPFFPVKQDSLWEGVVSVYGCKEDIKPIGLIADRYLSKIGSLLLGYYVQAADGKKPAFEMLPAYRLVETNDFSFEVPMFREDGGLKVPFLTFDAFADRFSSVSTQALDRLYMDYWYGYLELRVVLSAIRVPTLFFMDGPAPVNTLDTAMKAPAATSNVLVEQTVFSQNNLLQPDMLVVCAVVMKRSDIRCVIVSGQKDGEVIWQKNLYSVSLDHQDDGMRIYLRNLSIEYGSKMVWKEVSHIPFDQRRRLIALSPDDTDEPGHLVKTLIMKARPGHP